MCFLPGCFCNSLVFGIWFFPLEQTGHGLNKVGHCCHPLNVKNSVSVFIKTKWPLFPFLFSFFFDIFLYSKLFQPHICLAIYFSSLLLLTNLTLHKNFFCCFWKFYLVPFHPLLNYHIFGGKALAYFLLLLLLFQVYKHVCFDFSVYSYILFQYLGF